MKTAIRNFKWLLTFMVLFVTFAVYTPVKSVHAADKEHPLQANVVYGPAVRQPDGSTQVLGTITSYKDEDGNNHAMPEVHTVFNWWETMDGPEAQSGDAPDAFTYDAIGYFPAGLCSVPNRTGIASIVVANGYGHSTVNFWSYSVNTWLYVVQPYGCGSNRFCYGQHIVLRDPNVALYSGELRGIGFFGYYADLTCD